MADDAMWRHLFKLRANSELTLQAQVREVIAQAVLNCHLPPGTLLPPSRRLAQMLGISRNTVTLAYHALIAEKYLVSRPRAGFIVNPGAPTGASVAPAAASRSYGAPPDWSRRLGAKASRFPWLRKPQDWQRYPFPFVYGQFDPSLFPVAEWREVNQMALRTMSVREWAGDRVDADDATLIEQIQQRLLPRRGIWASPDEILVTVGAQQAAYLAAATLMGSSTAVGVEQPGYPDIWNICSLFGARLIGVPIDAAGLDAKGLDASARLSACDYVYVMPSHQNPTTVTMTLERRERLLRAAADRDFVIIEDDYESELTFDGEATPAIKSLDRDGRVIYIGSLSKTLAPGLRVGFLVGPSELIAEARAMRRLMLRHPPTNNQRAVALFLSLGHHDALIRKLVQAYRVRAQVLTSALGQHLPQVTFAPPRGGSAVWASAPAGTNMTLATRHAAKRGVLIDPGDVFFRAGRPPMQHFRLGYSSIASQRIDEGIRLLAQVVGELSQRVDS